MSIFKTSCFLLAAAVTSMAQAPSPMWVPLLHSPSNGLDLRWGLLQGDGNWQVFVKNFGTTTVHFDYQLLGVWSTKEVEANSRVHLDPKGKAMFLSGPMPTAIKVLQVRLGAEDFGPVFLP